MSQGDSHFYSEKGCGNRSFHQLYVTELGGGGGRALEDVTFRGSSTFREVSFSGGG